MGEKREWILEGVDDSPDRRVVEGPYIELGERVVVAPVSDIVDARALKELAVDALVACNISPLEQPDHPLARLRQLLAREVLGSSGRPPEGSG